MDTNQDGYIQFIEFLRASCMKQNIVLPDKHSIYDMLRIGEIIDYKHMTQKEKQGLVALIYDL